MTFDGRPNPCRWLGQIGDSWRCGCGQRFADQHDYEVHVIAGKDAEREVIRALDEKFRMSL